MALAFDKISTVSTGTSSWSFNHTPVGTPRAVVVLIAENASTGDVISGVTYGGTAMSRVTTDADTSGEPGRVYAYFLGTGIGTGMKAVAITVATGTTAKAAVCITATAAYDTALAGTTGYASTNGDQADPSLSITGIGSGTPALGFGAFFSGLNNPDMTAGSGYTQATYDYGTKSCSFEYANNPTSGGNVTVNWTASSDDVAALV